MTLLQEKDFFTGCQNGFVKGRSMLTNFLDTSDILNAEPD